MDRVVLARQRLDRLSDETWKTLEAGPPCSSCRHKTATGLCANPALSSLSFEPSVGKYDLIHHHSVVEARSEAGLCGPEAILWDGRTPVQAVVDWMDRNPTISTVGLLAFAGILLDTLF